jgi:sec-independent protein translocase protein TatA
MPALGPWELVIILLIVVVIFGAGRLAEIGGALGKSVREFRSSTQEPDKDKNEPAAASTQAATAAPVATTHTSAPASAASVPENKCPSCATVNPAGQAFCGQCGTRLTRAA